MCGIIAAININVYKMLLDGLIQLQNRGYDSAGISILNNNKFNIIKKASSNEENAIEFLKNPEFSRKSWNFRKIPEFPVFINFPFRI